MRIEGLSSQDAYAFLTSTGGFRDDDLTARLNQKINFDYQVFQLSSGEVLTVLPNMGNTLSSPDDWQLGQVIMVSVYSSREELEKMIEFKPTPPLPYVPPFLSPEEVEAVHLAGRQFHALEGVQPYGARFPEYVPRLIELLPTYLYLSPEVLDGTFWTLDQVEEAMIWKGQDILEPANYVCLIAYIGEVIRRALQGEWRMETFSYLPDGEPLWKPCIVAKGMPLQAKTTQYKQYKWITPFIPVSYPYHWDQGVFFDIAGEIMKGTERPLSSLVQRCLWQTFSPEEKIRAQALFEQEEGLSL
jgi:hypothetical protein